MQEQSHLKFCPSAKFVHIQGVLASSDVIATLADPSQVAKLFGPAVGLITQSERLCSVPQMAAVLQWVVEQASACRLRLQAHPLKLLPTLRSVNTDSISSHIAISTSLCCQLLCGMFLDCFGEGSRPEHGNWPCVQFEGMLLSNAGSSAFSTLLCIMQCVPRLLLLSTIQTCNTFHMYLVSVHASLSQTHPLTSDSSFVVLHRCAVGSSSSLRRVDSISDLRSPLCPVIVSYGSLEPKICQGHIVVDFANKSIGGGVLLGGNVQEEIMFSRHPEAIVSCLLCETMYKTESIMIYGVRCFSQTEGYGASFTFLQAAQPPSPSATVTILDHSVAATAGASRTQAPNYSLSLVVTHHSTLQSLQSMQKCLFVARLGNCGPLFSCVIWSRRESDSHQLLLRAEPGSSASAAALGAVECSTATAT
jgi:hypothetical protein